MQTRLLTNIIEMTEVTVDESSSRNLYKISDFDKVGKTTPLPVVANNQLFGTCSICRHYAEEKWVERAGGEFLRDTGSAKRVTRPGRALTLEVSLWERRKWGWRWRKRR